VAVTTDATLRPACSSTTREGYLTYLTEIACTLQPVNPRSTNRLNLRNELDSLGIEDFLERTDHHLPYPLRRTRLSALVVAVTFGVVDTCSTSSGCLRPTFDWEEQVWVAVRHRIEDLSNTALTRLRVDGLNKVRQADAFRRPHSGRTLAPNWAPNRWPPTL